MSAVRDIPNWRNDRDLSRSKRTGKVENDERADWSDAWELFLGTIAYVWHAALHSPTSYESLLRTGFSIRAQIIWAKERLVIGRGDYHWQDEPCQPAGTMVQKVTTNWIWDRPKPMPRWPASCSIPPAMGTSQRKIFWLKTRARWKEAPSEHQHTGAFGTFDVREMSDEALERIVFGASPNLPPMSVSERRTALAPVLRAVVSASTDKSEPGAG
jgi:hypothetical protein